MPPLDETSPLLRDGDHVDNRRADGEAPNGVEAARKAITTVHRKMRLFEVVGISFASIGILTGMSSAFQTGLFSGGPFSLFWGWNICFVFMLLIALCLAEMCSCFSKAGGPYFWVSRLKPDVPMLGYITGNVYAVSLIFTAISGTLSTALFLTSIVEVHAGHSLSKMQIVAITWLVNIVAGIVNTFGARAIGALNSFNVWFIMFATIFLTLVLLLKAPHLNSLSFVMFDYENYTGYQSKPFVIILGFLQAVYTLEGCESAAQIAEETHRPEILGPTAIVVSIIGSWFFGLIYMVSLLLTVQDIDSIRNTHFSIPIAQLYTDILIPSPQASTSWSSGLLTLCLLFIALTQFIAAVSVFTGSSRILLALARDDGVPFARSLERLNRWNVPWVGVWSSVGAACVVSLVYLIGKEVFGAILSSVAVSVLLAYAIPIMCRVFWPSSLKERGPFRLGSETFSWVLHVISLIFALGISVFFLLPTEIPVTVANANYAAVAISGLVAFVSLGWAFWGRHRYRGAEGENDMDT